jgi:predicted dehydrogenase
VSRVRAAIVGTGNIAGHHIKALTALADEAEVVAGVDVEADRLEAFCGENGIPGGYTSVEAMLAAERPDLVHICTPPSLHCEQALACLEAGASVLTEKPPTLSLAELDALEAAQGDDGPWLATVFQHRFGSGAQRLRRLLAENVLGRPLVAICHTTWFRDQAYFDVPWRGNWATEGGGPTMGHGIHQMDLIGAVLGEWTELTSIVRRQARDMDTEDLSLAHLTFANGAVASIVNSVISPREETYLRFDFEHATIELTHLYGYGDSDWRVTAAPGHEEAVTTAWQDGAPDVRSGHLAQLREILACLRDGTPPPVTIEEARRTMQIVAGVYASAFGGRPVTPEELGPGSPFYERMDGDGAPWAVPAGGQGGRR